MKAFISLGSNLGDREAVLREAVRRVSELEGVTLRELSPTLETDPVGVTDQPRFLNAVAELETDLEPENLLRSLQGIETDLGRTRERRWGPRTLDLDILLYDDLQVATETLTIPHPRMCDRRFVLEPLSKLAPDFTIPGTGRTAREILEGMQR